VGWQGKAAKSGKHGGERSFKKAVCPTSKISPSYTASILGHERGRSAKRGQRFMEDGCARASVILESPPGFSLSTFPVMNGGRVMAEVSDFPQRKRPLFAHAILVCGLPCRQKSVSRLTKDLALLM
jgi:hypothetical protein